MFAELDTAFDKAFADPLPVVLFPHAHYADFRRVEIVEFYRDKTDRLFSVKGRVLRHVSRFFDIIDDGRLHTKPVRQGSQRVVADR